jgi:TPP-dependent pyruvate/acetoin dehydrogenase alpha subunit
MARRAAASESRLDAILPEQDLLTARVYRSAYLIRRVEEEVARVYPTDRIKSPVHLSIGQEAMSVGVCDVLEAGDVVFGTYRGHAAYLAKGGDVRRMIAELYGKATGCAGGKGGSMHLIDVEHGVMGMSAVVGTTIPHAAGYAYALQLRRTQAVVACFLGDGATEEGVFYETLNFAALKALPLLFVVENNGYAIHSPIATRQKNVNIAMRVAAFGVQAVRLDSDDIWTLRDTAAQAISSLRAGEGPRLIEVPTYRWREHVGPAEDYLSGYRSVDEARPWFDNDQVRLTGARLPDSVRTTIEQQVEDEVADAFAFAEASPYPSDDELWTHVYAD